MKKFIFSILFTLIVFPGIINAQQGGWRDREMEVRVILDSSEDYQNLSSLKLSGDVYPGYAIMYVVPSEMNKIHALGLQTEVLKADLNSYYMNFWSNREEYHTYEEIIQTMSLLALVHPTICKKVDYGTSIEGRQLTALKISDNVTVDENEAEIGFDGGIHGDEIGAAENLIRFAEYLCESYNNEPEITELINEREIWLYIMVNPDGRVNMVRYNSNNVDLNRDWGYMWDGWGNSTGYYSQPESKALRDWMLSNQFVIYSTYHSGTEILLYAWSYRPDDAADEDVMDYLGSIYCNASGYPNLPYGQGYDGLYAINGATKDAGYGIMGSCSWTIEISNDKQPPTTQILQYYQWNLPSMVELIKYSGYGIKGTVTDAVTGEPLPAIIFVDDRYPTYADPLVGDYHKYLLPGTYTVKAIANGYESMTKGNIVVTDQSVTTCNFALTPGGGDYAYQIPACRIPDNNFDDEGNTPGVLGEPDDINYSIGKSGWVIVDMGQSILDGPGQEIRIHEGDNDPEGYQCYASNSVDGPWIMLGPGMGSTSFEFSSANIMEARYIRILDDGDGQASGDNAGFDLDAIEVLEQPQVIQLRMNCTVLDENGNNNGRLDPGETGTLSITLRNHGGLTAEGTTANINFDSTWVNIPDPDLEFGDIPHTFTAEALAEITVSDLVPYEEIIMMVLNITANDGSFTLSLPFHFTIGELVDDFETGNFTKFPWTFPAFPWVISPINPYEGSFSAKSGNIGDGQTSSLEIILDVIGYDDISFYRKVSSEANADYLQFFIDGIKTDQWAGNIGWEKVTYQIAPGLHTFRWSFVKDADVSQGFDCGWIDYIVLPSYNTDDSLHALANAFPHGYCSAGESQLGVYLVGGSGTYSFNWSPDYNISSTSTQFPVATPDTSTTYTAQVFSGLLSATSSKRVTVYGIPQTPVIQQQGDSIISSAAEGNQWHDSNGPIAGANGQVFYPSTQDAFYTIVTSQYGCVSDTSNIVNFLFTGISEKPENNIRIYPNPVKEELNLLIPDGWSAEVVIYDIVGQRVYSSRKSSGWSQIRTKDLPGGVYFLNVLDMGGKGRLTIKIVK